MKMNDLGFLAPNNDAAVAPEVFQWLGTRTRELHDTLTQLGLGPRLQAIAEGLLEPRAAAS